MTLNDIFTRLESIDLEAQSLISDAGFSSDTGLGLSVCQNPEDPNDAYLQDEAEQLLEPFEVLHEELRYLRHPFRGEYILECLPDGRPGFYDEEGYRYSLHCGQGLEAKIRDRRGRLRWIRSRIEHDGEDFYLVGCPHMPLSNLPIRVKEGFS